MRVVFINILFFLVLVVISFSADAQTRRRKHNKLVDTRAILHHERLGLTGGIGLSSYYGDLCDSYSCMKFRPNLGIGAMLRMNDNWGVKTDINYVRLYSDDCWEQRNFNFRSFNFEFLTAGYYQYFPYERFHHRRKPWNVYGFLGLGITYFNSKGEFNGEWVALRKLQTEGKKYSSVTFMIPFGGGVSFTLNKKWELITEIGYRKTFTDYLDDVSGQGGDGSSNGWQPLTSFSDPVAAALSNKTGMGDGYWEQTTQPRGNPTKMDGYFVAQVKAKYIISSSRTHYRLRRAPLRKRF